MKNFTLIRFTSLPQEKIFHISTDVKNFHNVMPSYFKSLDVIKEKEAEQIVIEKIKFLGIPLKIKTKHVIEKPDVNKVYILSGPTKGTIFLESYLKSENGTKISIDVTLKFNGFFRIFSFLEDYFVKKMNAV